MLAAKKPVTRTIYEVDMNGLSKILALVASRDYQEAIMFAKKIYVAKKGNEKRPLTYAEIKKFISKGFK